ncbi:hypothetical protein [Actinomadura sp. WMMB 499]|uniref:hypothetical protein n=1 Tax=Actinomadura sp. WMMB 499 TaxID=1219491 RepID=UPI001245BAF8|nr:hypothetical protein [Actinomadura sp. WMMB 499]QFG23671.1 hypothetical protein F7P10_23660 [Actinomadura sp. WMMB 499]
MTGRRESVADGTSGGAGADDAAWRGALRAEDGGERRERTSASRDRWRGRTRRAGSEKGARPPYPDGGGDADGGESPKGPPTSADRKRGDRWRAERWRGDRWRGDGKRGDGKRGDRSHGERPRGDRSRGDRKWSDRRSDRRRDGRAGPGTLLAGWGLVGWCVVAAAVVFLGWSAWTVWRDEPAAGPSGGRAVVLRAAERHIGVLNSMDAGDVDGGLRAWLGATTGALHAHLREDEAANRRKIGESGTDAAATVTGAAVTSLDERAGKAEVIASVRVRLTLRGGEPTMQRKRFEAELARTPQGWKLESLTSVPVGAR